MRGAWALIGRSPRRSGCGVYVGGGERQDRNGRGLTLRSKGLKEIMEAHEERLGDLRMVVGVAGGSGRNAADAGADLGNRDEKWIRVATHILPYLQLRPVQFHHPRCHLRSRQTRREWASGI